VARQLVAEGHWSAARELFLVIVSKYDGTAGSLEALRWLTRYYASGEARHRAEREGLVFMPKAHAPKRTVEVVRPANFVEPAIEGADLPNAWPRACLELEAKIGAYGPLYAREPGTVHCALAARRQLGLVGDASKVIDGYFRSMPAAAGLTPGQDSWRDTMATEAWLANPNLFKQPKPLALCPKTSLRPFLDGKLDDECWAAFQAMDLTRNSGPMTGFSTKVYLAHDEDFLYVAVACSHPEGRQMPKVEKRRRDGDVSGRDRIDFSLDLDRDSQSYYRFQIDQTGCVAEDCWGDKSWNPRWFVCVEASPTGWSAELAIPRSELSSQAPAAGTIWGMNVCRLIPGRGVQSWSGPASAAPRPEGFGLMRFLSK
jgi:hypothetical protein